MGKFLRDPRTGDPVAIDGGLVLEKTLDRKPRDCEQCGYNKWVKNDKIFMVQGGDWNLNGNLNLNGNGRNFVDDNNNGSGETTLTSSSSMQVMQWICPDCALKRGLHPQFYHKNFYSTATSPETLKRLIKERNAAEAAETEGESNGNGSGCGFGGFWDSWTSLFTVCHS